MDDLKEMQDAIAAMEKHTSLRQIALQSGINYLTLRNIKSGKSTRVTSGVKARFDTFKNAFSPSAAAPAAKAPAKKKPAAKKAKAPAKAKAAKKAAPAAKKAKPGPKKAAPAAKKAKPGPKKKAGRKPGPRKGARKAVTQAKPSKLDFASPMLGQALDREIEIAEARLEYLHSLKEIENEFLKAVGRK